MSLNHAHIRHPATTNNTETKKKQMAVGSKLKNGENFLVIMVKIGEKITIAKEFRPKYERT